MKITVFMLAFLITTQVYASVGKVTALNGSAIVERSNEVIKAKIGLPIQQQDTVVTHDKTQLQMIFNDSTIISLGKNTIFRVAQFSFNTTDSQNQQVEFSLNKGVMKSVTGKIGKKTPANFKVKTPNATIGVKGTTFTLNTNAKFTQLTTLKGATFYYDNKTKKTYDVPKNHTLVFNHKTGQVTITIINSKQAFNAVHLLSGTDLPYQDLADADQTHQSSMQDASLSKNNYNKVTVGSGTYSEYGYWENPNTNLANSVWAGAVTTASQTPANTVSNLIATSATASYTGNVVAFNENHQQGSGTIAMNVDFGAATLAVVGQLDYTINGTRWLNQFSGDVQPTGLVVNNINPIGGDISATAGSISGNFYGPGAEEVAGTFSLSGQDSTSTTHTSTGSYNAIMQ
ncbi:hypothetical protein JCM30760_00240 [Thiomicrorhabdus hydrogeniphila]